jgi:hypothetical protein
MCRGRAIVKNMAEMGITTGAEDLGSHHPVAGIGTGQYVRVAHRGRETWPAGSRIKLGFGGEEIRATTDTLVYPIAMKIMI